MNARHNSVLNSQFEEVRERVRQFVIENFLLGAAPSSLGDAHSFLEHHVIDSTGFIELVTWLEETFGIKVADAEMVPENLDSLNNVTAYVLRKRG